MISLSQIQCFVMTVDQGSVTAAARALGVSPQAVSKSVNDLERSLGRSLFVRRQTGLKPTPYGITFCKKARHMLEEARELEDFSKGRTVANRHDLVLLLCIPKTANFASLSRKIGNFLTSRLGTSVIVEYSSFDRCVERLAFGEADGVITVGKTVLMDLDVHVIDSVDVGVLTGMNHPLAEKGALRLEDVLEYPLYVTPDFPFFNTTVLEQFKHSEWSEDLRLMRLSMSIHGVFDALANQRGCIVMPVIEGVRDWLPGTTTTPFDVSDVSRVPLCLVTTREDKTDYCVALENLLVRGSGERLPVSQTALGQVDSEDR